MINDWQYWRSTWKGRVERERYQTAQIWSVISKLQLWHTWNASTGLKARQPSLTCPRLAIYGTQDFDHVVHVVQDGLQRLSRYVKDEGSCWLDKQRYCLGLLGYQGHV